MLGVIAALKHFLQASGQGPASPLLDWAALTEARLWLLSARAHDPRFLGFGWMEFSSVHRKAPPFTRGCPHSC